VASGITFTDSYDLNVGNERTFRMICNMLQQPGGVKVYPIVVVSITSQTRGTSKPKWVEGNEGPKSSLKVLRHSFYSNTIFTIMPRVFSEL